MLQIIYEIINIQRMSNNQSEECLQEVNFFYNYTLIPFTFVGPHAIPSLIRIHQSITKYNSFLPRN